MMNSILTITLAVFTAASIPMALAALRMLHLIQITLARMEEQLSSHSDGIRDLKKDQERQDKEIGLLSVRVNNHSNQLAVLNTNSKRT
jgi:hypothetical protein